MIKYANFTLKIRDERFIKVKDWRGEGKEKKGNNKI